MTARISFAGPATIERLRRNLTAYQKQGAVATVLTTARVGTSGWAYTHWKGPFYPSKMASHKFLDFYARHFNTVEVDGSFYRLPTPAALKEWYRTVPKGFIFALKASRYLTHMKKLKEAKEPLHRFLRCADKLHEKLGPLLVQLPPYWKINIERLKEFLALLPNGYRFTIEFRDRSWVTPEVLDLLSQHRVAFCIYELAGHLSPLHVTCDFVYVRLHGPEKPTPENTALTPSRRGRGRFPIGARKVNRSISISTTIRWDMPLKMPPIWRPV